MEPPLDPKSPGHPGFTPAENAIISEVQRMMASPEMEHLHQAYRESVSRIVCIGGRLIQYEPGLPASGMTLFGAGGFVLGPEALTSRAELIRTCLHELHRLITSQVGSGAAIDHSLVHAETQAAFGFAQRAYDAYFGEG
jgi:hypothetical protein